MRLALVAALVLVACKHNSVTPPTCADNLRNGNETDVDCGGGVCPTCNSGRGCTIDRDCRAKRFVAGVCAAPSCSDGVQNGSESDVDCGGPDCHGDLGTPCSDGKVCAGNNDCRSSVCTGGTCQTPSCSDGFKNGDEVGIDCGGSCPPCDG